MNSKNGSARVLLVEDDPALRHLIRQRLRDEGWAVTAHTTLAQATQHLAENQVDLIILDWIVPDAEGRRLMRAWQASPVARPPVILISAEAVDPEQLGLAHVSRYLAKPFDIRLLVRHARQVLRQTQAASGLKSDLRAEGAHLAAQIRRALDLALQGARGYDVDVQDGVVTLYGEVRTPALQYAASEAVLRTPGVRLVINRLQVQNS